MMMDMKLPPSIFNDVIGPVMRGPSSSHTAASVRIGNLAAALLADPIAEAHVDFDPKGSLATTYRSQGSAIGLVAGFLGYDTKAAAIISSEEEALRRGMKITFNVLDYPTTHPNTYRISLKSITGETASLIAISTGGGMIEITEINGFPVSICGDFYETLLQTTVLDSTVKQTFKEIENQSGVEFIVISETEQGTLINIKTAKPLPESVIDIARQRCDIQKTRVLSPVLPTLSRKNCAVPFLSAADIIKTATKGKMDLSELALLYESDRGNCSKEEIWNKMQSIVAIMKDSIASGMKGTEYNDRILGSQAGKISQAAGEGKIIPCNLINTVTTYTIAMMEVKSSMGVIVAAPTAGSCAVLPGAILGTAAALKISDDQCVRAMLAAGLIGVLIAEHSTFSAEVCGCQAECGAGSGMAAAGVVQLMGGTTQQAIAAASIALQNIMGMICDPVANRVEVPCLGKNVMAATNAITSANMALAGVDPVIPLDEVILAMDAVGRSLPYELRCTGYGGLSVTPTSKSIEEKLNKSSNCGAGNA